MQQSIPTNATHLGTARCSEAEPQCTDVYRTADNDIIFANDSGVITIPASEVEGALRLANTATMS